MQSRTSQMISHHTEKDLVTKSVNSANLVQTLIWKTSNEDVLIDDDEQRPFTVQTVLNTRGRPPTNTRPLARITQLPTPIINSVQSSDDANNVRTPPEIIPPALVSTKQGRKPHTAEQKAASKLVAQEKKSSKRARVNEINNEQD
jgi:hypothetical protein